ncbi:hypothetical protein [Rhodanobacter sp. PCA2]|uniref:hypothetical protein n=1 Tax=Rhodanobacter sp. PCA2 TaxID=2006117 RepID=UPI0015E7807D|nr:hypothetical protein [Rhodanobacter sp. PCA2]MBA2079142.1 hypothetical protein [Rhodanobacter sp. PCA2]
MRHTLIALAAAVVLGSASFGAHADTLGDVFTQGHADGELRLYNFDRIYDSNAKPDAHALSGALLLNLRTAEFGDGFSLGASLLTANALGTRPSNPDKLDTTMMGDGNSLSALGQAYVQYKNHGVLVRAGQQYLNTPWMGSSDARVLPASYQAVLAGFTPAKGWDIYGLRSFGWKSRTSDGYHFDNLYYPVAYRGDALYGGIAGLPATAKTTPGTWALGTTWESRGFKGQAWYYDFIDFARMGYADGSYTFKTGSGFDPFVAAQYVEEHAGSGSIPAESGLALFGVGGHKVDSRAWGANAGINIPHGKFDVSWNRIGQQGGAIGGGALVSPYTAGWASDPLYTTSMIRGLVEQGPGTAWKARFSYGLLDDRLLLTAAYASYETKLRGDSHDVYFDAIYNFDGYLKGLSLRNRWERSTGGTGLNPGNRPFVYNRLMVAYKF